MSVWYPTIPLRRLPAMVRITTASAILTGIYGALNDQISYTISPEYFTKVKFAQFAWADFGWPPRIFAGLVGFLGSWWVGLIGGWLLARLGLAELAELSPRHYFLSAFVLAMGIAMTCAALGAMLAVIVSRGDGLEAWKPWQDHLGLEDLPGFVIVAYIHWASYLGGALGIVCAIVYVKSSLARLKRSSA